MRPIGLLGRLDRLDPGDGVDEVGLGVEGECDLALLARVLALRDLQSPLDALGLHHHSETGGATADLYRNPYHLPPFLLAEIVPARAGYPHLRASRPDTLKDFR